MHRKQKLYVQLVLRPYNYHKMMSARRKEFMEICNSLLGCVYFQKYIYIYLACATCCSLVFLFCLDDVWIDKNRTTCEAPLGFLHFFLAMALDTKLINGL